LDTDTDSKKTPVTDALTFAAIDDPNINDMYSMHSTADSDWKDEDTMFKELFPDFKGGASSSTPAASEGSH
uniref:phage tail protein n=1 Tax=Bartonella sp. CL71SXKL TaxID=3243540 RepID=UPI0035CF11B8